LEDKEIVTAPLQHFHQPKKKKKDNEEQWGMVRETAKNMSAKYVC
jgi:hypothetical protein